MYLKNILHGDFGVSLKMQKNRAVLDIIVDMFPVSAKVGALALAWAILVGVPLGCLAAFKRGKLTDSILRVICTLGISMPSFVVASVLLVTLTGNNALNLFPSILIRRRDGAPMYCHALPWAFTQCAIQHVRHVLPCWIP